MYDEGKVEEALELCEDIKKFYEPQKAKYLKNNSHAECVHEQEAERIVNARFNSNRERSMIYVPLPSKEKSDKGKREKEDSCLLTVVRNIGSLFLCVLIAYGAARMIMDYLVLPTRVEGISMETTLFHDDILLINKLDYRFQDPRRFDIVVFPYSMNEYYVKRIIGLPEETVFIEDGTIYINGEPLLEQYGQGKILDGGIAKEPVKLGKDEFFLMGDNRNHSTDSRSDLVGPVSKAKIIGKVWFRIYPFEVLQKFN